MNFKRDQYLDVLELVLLFLRGNIPLKSLETVWGGGRN